MSDSPHIHLNLNVRGLPQSATVAINEHCNRLKAEGRDIYKLGLGQSPFPVPELVTAALREHAGEKYYLPTKGLLRLREAVARHHERVFGIKCSPDDVLVGPGSKELMFILQLAYYGDILIPTPAWVSYAPQARIIGRRVQFIETRREAGWRLTAEDLDAACRSDPSRPRVLVLNYPSNPTGCTYSRDELEAIAQTARRYKVVVLSDEIYAKLTHEGQHQSIVPIYPEGTIFSGGLSKWCGAGGWRLGLFVIPPGMRWLLDAMASVASETFTSTSAPIQHAAVSAFEPSAQIDAYLVNSCRVVRALGRAAAGRLNAAGIDVAQPEGGFYLFPDFSPLRARLEGLGIRSSVQLCARILEDTGVAILPGSDFGRPASELTARLAYVEFDGAKALDAASQTDASTELGDAFAREHCGRTVQAIERIVAWLPG